MPTPKMSFLVTSLISAHLVRELAEPVMPHVAPRLGVVIGNALSGVQQTPQPPIPVPAPQPVRSTSHKKRVNEQPMKPTDEKGEVKAPEPQEQTASPDNTQEAPVWGISPEAMNALGETCSFLLDDLYRNANPRKSVNDVLALRAEFPELVPVIDGGLLPMATPDLLGALVDTGLQMKHPKAGDIGSLPHSLGWVTEWRNQILKRLKPPAAESKPEPVVEEKVVVASGMEH